KKGHFVYFCLVIFNTKGYYHGFKANSRRFTLDKPIMACPIQLLIHKLACEILRNLLINKQLLIIIAFGKS
ncbi:hypothetical protein EFR28_04980, partial [Latilactobacillus curvatus]|nr:hypothetical protein [Latilactobacillus curvatus]